MVSTEAQTIPSGVVISAGWSFGISLLRLVIIDNNNQSSWDLKPWMSTFKIKA